MASSRVNWANLGMTLGARPSVMCSSAGMFHTVFTSEDVMIIRTPVRAPNANAFAERWVRTVREECLDRIVILNERHLHRVLTTYVKYYNHVRPHQGIDQRCPIPLESAARDGPIERRDILGGVIHDYYRRAAYLSNGAESPSAPFGLLEVKERGSTHA